MIIERKNNEVIIRLPATVNTEGLQDVVDFLVYKEAVSDSKATQSEVDKLAKEVKSGWWENNRSRLMR